VSRLALPLLCAALVAPLLYAGDFSSYRGMHFGMSLASVEKQSGLNQTEAITTHQRPALIQEINWSPRPSVLVDTAKADPVRDAMLCFYNGELFRIVITYDRYKVEGMTPDDMIEGISATYGPATRPTADIAYHSIYGETAKVLARWEDPQYSYNLVRTGDRSSFAMVLYSKTMDASAQTAITESVRLDAQEAPQREIDKQKKRDQDDHLSLEKLRSANKLNFRP